jgi:carbonic anhydrase
MIRPTMNGFRRCALTGLVGGALLLALALRSGSPVRAEDAHAVAADGPTSAQATSMLMEGNARYVAEKSEHPNQSAKRRADVAKGQRPFAVILACADSRVGPEVIFDAGLGDLFVVRVAGNIADDSVLGSIEYAVEHLGAPLVVVVGHERCGAVQATVDTVAAGQAPPPHLDALINAIKPALAEEKPTPAETLVDRVIDANVRNVVHKIAADEPVAALVKEGKVQVVGGRYDLDTGEFKLFETPKAAANAHGD